MLRYLTVGRYYALGGGGNYKFSIAPHTDLQRSGVMACAWMDGLGFLDVCGCVRILMWCDRFGGLRRQWGRGGGVNYIKGRGRKG